jgi:hypothetical protein
VLACIGVGVDLKHEGIGFFYSGPDEFAQRKSSTPSLGETGHGCLSRRLYLCICIQIVSAAFMHL